MEERGERLLQGNCIRDLTLIGQIDIFIKRNQEICFSLCHVKTRRHHQDLQELHQNRFSPDTKSAGPPTTNLWDMSDRFLLNQLTSLGYWYFRIAMAISVTKCPIIGSLRQERPQRTAILRGRYSHSHRRQLVTLQEQSGSRVNRKWIRL